MFGLGKRDCERAKNMAIYHIYATDKELQEMAPGLLVVLIILVIGFLILANYFR